MGKDKVEKKEKRAEKKEKRADKDGVHKAGKKEKKDKKDKIILSDAVEKEITSQVLDGLDQAASAVVEDPMVVDGERPIGALVPFANPLVEDKQAKKVLKSVKKGKSCSDSIDTLFGLHSGFAPIGVDVHSIAAFFKTPAQPIFPYYVECLC